MSLVHFWDCWGITKSEANNPKNYIISIPWNPFSILSNVSWIFQSKLIQTFRLLISSSDKSQCKHHRQVFSILQAVAGFTPYLELKSGVFWFIISYVHSNIQRSLVISHGCLSLRIQECWEGNSPHCFNLSRCSGKLLTLLTNKFSSSSSYIGRVRTE